MGGTTDDLQTATEPKKVTATPGPELMLRLMTLWCS